MSINKESDLTECQITIDCLNVNGALKSADEILTYLEKFQPSILCLQETKVANLDFLELHKYGYDCIHSSPMDTSDIISHRFTP